MLKTPIFYICNDPERALGLENTLKDFHIICIDNNPIVDYIKDKGLDIISLSRELHKDNPIFRNSNRLLQHHILQSYIKDHTPNGIQPNVVVFKVAPNTEITAKNLGYRLLNTSARLNRMFEFKLTQYEALKNANISLPKTIIIELGKTSFSEIRNELGDKFVIQYNRGHTGSSTVFVNTESDFIEQQSKFPKRTARITQFIKGVYWTINACVTRFGIAYGGLSYQITGIPECTSKKGGTVGNDWQMSRQISSKSRKQIEYITVNTGTAMAEQGYRGMFGIDIVVDENEDVFFIETNARETQSVPMHTKIMLKAKQIPLQALHFAEFLFDNDNDYLEYLNTNFGKNLALDNIRAFLEEQSLEATNVQNYSQLFLRNTDTKAIKIKQNFTPGIYDAKSLVFLREGYSIDDIANEQEIMILSAGVNREIAEDNEIARVQAPFSLLLQDGTISDDTRKIVQHIKNNIVLE